MQSDRSIIDSDTLKKVGGQLGTNPAGLYEDAKGQRYYIKILESPEHARNEFIAAMLYQLAGAPTLNYVHTKADKQIATHWLELDKRCVAHLSEAERKQAKRWFGVHAWTANWDAAGYTGDNQGVANGKVITLDVGGALAYRAHGDPKGAAFANEVNEIDALRKDDSNPHAMNLFGDMNPVEIRQAIEVVTNIPDETIHQVIIKNGGSDQLAEQMIKRKENMQARIADIK